MTTPTPTPSGRRKSDRDRVITRAALVRRTIFGLLACAFGATIVWRMVITDHEHAALLIWLGIALLAYGGYHVSQRVTEDFSLYVREALAFWRER